MRPGPYLHGWFLFAVLLICPTSVRLSPGAGETNTGYAASTIPYDLREGANAVVRKSVHKWVITSISKAQLHVEEAITILNESGRVHGAAYIYYDRFRKVRRLRGKIFRADGTLMRKIKRAEILDVSLADNATFFSDSRAKIIEFAYGAYPFTIEYSYVLVYNGYLNLDRWQPLKESLAVESASLTVSHPTGLPVRYHLLGGMSEPGTSLQDGIIHLTWSLEGEPAPDIEPYGPPVSDQTPGVVIAPSAFAIEKTSGDMSSWSSFGRWYYELASQDLTLPEQAAWDVHALIDRVDGEREKIRLLYQYLQDQTRYVSIQLGIGGWRPYPPSYVYANKYGDCKALTTYMQAMLKEVGIPSSPVLVRAGSGEPGLREEFPSNSFNHIILSVPQPRDTIWLECTSSTSPFNHLGAFTEGRKALLIEPQGGRIISIPASTSRANMQVRRSEITIASDGSAEVTSATTFTGNQQDRVRGALVDRSPGDRVKWLRNQYEFSGGSLNHVDVTGIEDRSAEVTTTLQFSIPRLGNYMGSRIFLPIAPLERRDSVPPENKHRKHPVIIWYPYRDEETTIMNLPAGYVAGKLPLPVRVTSSFGSYGLTVSDSGSKIVVTRYLEVNRTRLAPEDYDQFREFYQQVASADARKLIIRRAPE